MVVITKQNVSKIRHEYRIASPATNRDMSELMLTIQSDMEAAGRDPRFDNAFHIESWDDQLLAYWDEDKVVSE